MNPSLASVPGPGHSDDRGAEAPDQDTRLLGLAERFLAVTDLPDELAALRRMVADQAVAMAKLLVYVDKLQARNDRLEVRIDRLERRPTRSWLRHTP